jgi:CheY-like chemotaxis protein
LDQPCVLLCDDEALIREAYSEALLQVGYKVAEAPDATFAQTLLLSGLSVDVLVADVRMPGAMNGVELAEWVREKFPDVRIVVATAWAGVELQERASKFDAMLMKPFLPERLVDAVAGLVPPSPDQRKSAS